VWTHEFEYAQYIVRVLRAQFAFLFKDSLRLRLRFRAENRPVYKELNGKALRIVWERPEAWEVLLFGQVLVDEVEACAEIRREHHLGLVFGSGEHISDPTDAVAWMQPKLNEVRRMIDAFNVIMGQQLQQALGPLGTPGDPEAIVFAAKKVGALYRHAIEWSQAIRRTHVPECFQPVAEAMAGFTDDVISRVEEFGTNILTQVPVALARRGKEPPEVLDLTLVLTLSNEEGFHAALQKAETDCFGIKQRLKRWL
jgi:hypothetical protein